MDRQVSLITPFRFACVEEGIYRGAYPMPKNFLFLRCLKLRTIVSLTPKPPTQELLDFCQANGVQNCHVSVPKFKEAVTLTASQVSGLLTLLLQRDSHPLLVHCLDGAHVTGTLIMCLRKLQLWGHPAITDEFIRFTRDGAIGSPESEFVAGFQHEVEIPSNPPDWLWRGQIVSVHPTLKIIRPQEKGTPKQIVPGTTEKVVLAPRNSRLAPRVSRNIAALALEGLPEAQNIPTLRR